MIVLMMVMKRVAVLTGLILCSLIRAQDMFGDNKNSFVLLPAEVISSGVVSNIEFSSNGQFITFQRKDIATFESSLLGQEKPIRSPWFRYDRKSKTSIKMPVPETTDEVIALADNQSIFFSGADSNDPQGFLNLRTGALVKTTFKLENIRYLGYHADAPYFIVSVNESTIALMRPNGQSLSIAVPRKVQVFRPLASDSSTITFMAMLKDFPSKFGHLVYRTGDGTSSFTEKPREEVQKQMQFDNPRSKFWFENVGDLAFVKLMDLPKNLKTDLPTRAKLGTANCNPKFGPMSDCVAYEDAGALLIREIKPLDVELARKLAAKAAKTKAMLDAKNTALSLIIYASDMDDVLPGAEGWEAKVKPYCKDEALVRNFNYTYRGGNMASIENPSTTELGFTVGPGGRAVAYCDGHVKWIPDA